MRAWAKCQCAAVHLGSAQELQDVHLHRWGGRGVCVGNVCVCVVVQEGGGELQ